MDQIWRLNNNDDSCFEEENNYNSNAESNSNLRNSGSLDVSFYEYVETEVDRGRELSLSHRSSLTDSAYGTNEELSTRERSFNIDFCNPSCLNLHDSFHQETVNVCFDEQPTKGVKLPMNFNELLTVDLDSKALVPTDSKVGTTPTSKYYLKPKQIKRMRSDNSGETEKCPKLRNIYETPSTAEDIKSAILRSVAEPNLIGDFSKASYLPLIVGQHSDLKTISVTTMLQLLKGNFSHDLIFTIIDCRYPYEYAGGHINGAINLYTKNMVVHKLLNETALENNKLSDLRYVLIFHCEFSSSRAPSMYRFLRNFDRKLNAESYPYLYYPEMYLLDRGYKNFYTHCPNLCVPQSYIPMDHPNHSQDLSYYRERAKIESQPKI